MPKRRKGAKTRKTTSKKARSKKGARRRAVGRRGRRTGRKPKVARISGGEVGAYEDVGIEEEEFELTATTKGWTPRRRD